MPRVALTALVLALAAACAAAPAAHAQVGSGESEPPAALLVGLAAILLVLSASLAAREVQASRSRTAPPMKRVGAVPGAGAAKAPAPWRRRSPPAGAARARAVGYTTFPDRKRAVSPESRFQARRIEAACESRGLVLHKLVGDVDSPAGPWVKRPGLTHALELIDSGDATCLVVTSLSRLIRAVASLATLIDRLERQGARLVVIDIDLDTGTRRGRLAARRLAHRGIVEPPRDRAPRSGDRSAR